MHRRGSHILRRTWLAALSLVLLLGASNTAFAVTKYWAATGGNKSWNTGSNWSPTGVPGSSDDVILDNSRSDNDLQINANVDVASFTMQNGYKRDVGPTGSQTIRVRGNVTLNGTGQSSFTASTASMEVDGNLTVTSGEFRAASGTLTIDGTLTVADTFDASSGAITVGAMTLTGGSFNGGSSATGTLTVTGDVALSGSHSFTANSNAAATIRIGGNYSQSGTATFSGSSALRRIAGNFSLSGGTFTASSTVTRIGGAFSRTGGTFAANGGTVIFEATSARTHTLGSSTFATVKVSDGLVGHWSMDEGTGTTASDMGLGASNGTFMNTSGTPWVTSGLPSAITFANPAAGSLDGTNDYVDVPSPVIATNDSFSACGWVRFNTVGASGLNDTQTLISVDPQSSPAAGQVSGFILQYRGDMGGVFGVTTVRTNSTSGTQENVYATAFGRPSAGTWYHLCTTFNVSTSQLYLYVNGTAYGPTTKAATWNATGHVIIGTEWWGARQHYLNGRMDDIRVYDRTLSAAEVSTLYAGGRTGVTHTFSDAFTATSMFHIIEGTVVNGAATQTMGGGLAVYPSGVLTLSAAGSVALASGSTLYMNGRLNASNTSATIRSVSGNYAFWVGTEAWVRSTLNIDGLRVQNTDSNGMRINMNAGSVTTFTRFDNIAFSSGTGTRLLQIYAPSLYLTSSGCTFDAGVAASTTYSVTLTGNGTGDGETRAIFGGSTCATSFASCQASKSDDDANNDGVGDPSPAGNEAVVQFVRGAGTDVAGTIEGFPTAAFDWNTFAYYSTYVTFHDASGTADRVYVRTQTGGAEYYWETGSGEEIVGTPRWNTSGTSHYLYVATASGKVYRLIDNGSTLVPDSSGSWAGANNPFDCGCAIVTPLTINATNIWWGGTTSGPTTQKVWTLGQTSRAQPMGSPFTITPTITSAAPALLVSGSTNYLMLGLVGNIIKLNVSNQTLDATNTSPGAASVMGRISLSTNRLFAADSGGNVWAIDPNNFTGTNRVWQYTVGGGDQILGSISYESVGGTVHFGTEQGKIGAVLNATGTALTGYPFVPGSTSDKIRAAPLYLNGILIVGTTTGKLYVYDRNTGSGPAFIRQYYFGPTQSVSAVGYDSMVQRYMVTTADPTTKDGRLYFLDAITDPTATK